MDDNVYVIECLNTCDLSEALEYLDSLGLVWGGSRMSLIDERSYSTERAFEAEHVCLTVRLEDNDESSRGVMYDPYQDYYNMARDDDYISEYFNMPLYTWSEFNDLFVNPDNSFDRKFNKIAALL